MLNQSRIWWEYRKNQTSDLDIALIALSDEDSSDLANEYEFSTPATTGPARPITPGVHYMITGYPAVRNRVKFRGDNVPAMATYLVTDEIVSVATLRLNDKTDLDHFALSFKDGEVRSHSGELFRIPKPHGMSGGGVWLLDIDLQTMYSKSPVLVGIGIEYHKLARAFVATRVQRAIPLAHDLLSLASGVKPPDVRGQ